MNIEVRPFETSDRAHVAELASGHGEPADGDVWRRTVIADIDGVLAGAGTLNLNTMHQDVYSLEIDTTGTAFPVVADPLYHKLRAMRPEPWPVVWRTPESRPDRVEFAHRNGFALMVRCPVPGVDSTSREIQRWIAAHIDASEAELRSAVDCSTDELLDAWSSYYAWAHAPWLPIRSVEIVREGLANGLFTGLDRSLTTIAVRSGGIVAMAQVFPDVWGGQSSLVCAETVHRDEPEGQALVAAAMAGSLRRLAESGRRIVLFEGHEIDPHFGPLAASLPSIGSDPLLIFKAG